MLQVPENEISLRKWSGVLRMRNLEGTLHVTNITRT